MDENQLISLSCDDFYLCLLSYPAQELEDDQIESLMSDEMFAEELQFQETIMASIVATSPSITEILPKESGESSNQICEICIEKKDNDEMFPIQSCDHNGEMFPIQSCDHLYCITCITKYMGTIIQNHNNSNQEKNTGLPCPGLDCNGYLFIDNCREILPNHLINMWDCMICESMIDPSHRFYCPYKDCSSMLVNDSVVQIREAECPFCRRLFCVNCNVPWHSGIGCKEYEKLPANERGKEDLMFLNLVKEKEWKRCPRCKYFVEKSEGCLHITCRCRFEFCYACEETWTTNHGDCRK